MTEASSVLAPWSGFYTAIATAAATLTGLMFVVVTLMSGREQPEDMRDGVSTFSTPTVIHFGVALLISAFLIAPWRSLIGPGAVVGMVGLLGVIHMLTVLLRARRLTIYNPDLEDWIWYTILPSLAYVLLLAGGAMLLGRPGGAMFAIAAAVTLLVFIGLRNSWDVVTFITIEHRPTPPNDH